MRITGQVTAGRREDGAIVVAIAIEQSSLTFVCSNSYHPRPVPQHTHNAPIAAAGGLGQELMHQRLNLMYPTRHALAVSDSNSRYSVRLDLALDARRV
ncbi:MAG: hypothetical protein ABI120_14170 [Gemmatimonadaceae bacterium]